MTTKPTITDTRAEVLDAKSGEETAAAHEAWLTAEIETTLARKARGEMTYRPLDEVMRQHGFDAG